MANRRGGYNPWAQSDRCQADLVLRKELARIPEIEARIAEIRGAIARATDVKTQQAYRNVLSSWESALRVARGNVDEARRLIAEFEEAGLIEPWEVAA